MARKDSGDSGKTRNSTSERRLPKSDPRLVNYGEGVIERDASSGRYTSRDRAKVTDVVNPKKSK